MILEIQNIYTKYLGEANKVDRKCNKRRIFVLELEWELSMSNNEKTGSFTFSSTDCKSLTLQKNDLQTIKLGFFDIGYMFIIY